MAGIKRLRETSELKFARFFKEDPRIQPVILRYDSEFDAIMFLIVAPDTETIVHYLDDRVSLLYEPESLEVVGLQVEDFEHSFIPEHENIQRIWNLSGSAPCVEDFGDLVVTVEKIRPQIAHEVYKVTEDMLFGVEGDNRQPIPA